MSFVLGFGCVEKSLQWEVTKLVCDAIGRGEKVEPLLASWNDAAALHDKESADVAPERYSRITYLPHAKKLLFLHVNRRHPFSPDGWACLSTEVEL